MFYEEQIGEFETENDGEKGGTIGESEEKDTEFATDTHAYINRLKAAIHDSIRSYTRLETLYKLKCREVEYAKEKTRKELITELSTMVGGKLCAKVLAEKYGVEVEN